MQQLSAVGWLCLSAEMAPGQVNCDGEVIVDTDIFGFSILYDWLNDKLHKDCIKQYAVTAQLATQRAQRVADYMGFGEAEAFFIEQAAELERSSVLEQTMQLSQLVQLESERRRHDRCLRLFYSCLQCRRVFYDQHGLQQHDQSVHK